LGHIHAVAAGMSTSCCDENSHPWPIFLHLVSESERVLGVSHGTRCMGMWMTACCASLVVSVVYDE